MGIDRMSTVEANIHNANILIQTVDCDRGIAREEPLERGLKSAVVEKIDDTFDKVKNAIFGIAEEIGIEMDKHDHMPQGVDIEFSLSLASEAKLWVLTCGDTATIKVNLHWDKK